MTALRMWRSRCSSRHYITQDHVVRVSRVDTGGVSLKEIIGNKTDLSVRDAWGLRMRGAK